MDCTNNRMWHDSCVLDSHLILPHRSTTKINSVEMQGSQENSVDNFLAAKNAPGLNFGCKKLSSTNFLAAKFYPALIFCL